MRAAALSILFFAAMAFAGEYHVSPSGDDASPGTAAAPFRTIARAAEAAQSGDTCTLHAGTYRETLKPARSGSPGSPITFAAAAGETAIISGTEPVTGQWQQSGGIYTAATKGPVEQVFSGKVMLPEARFPNCKPEQIMDYPRAAAGPGTGYETLADPNLPAGDLTGAVVLLWNGDRWWSSTRRITSRGPAGELSFDKTYKRATPDQYHTHDPYMPKPGNPYIIYGARALLDTPGEWFYDAKAGTLQVMPIGQVEGIEIRRRKLGLDLAGLSHIQVRGLQFFAAALSLKDSTDCLVEDSHFRYTEHFREYASSSTPGEVISGKENELRRCSIAYAAGSGVRIRGENNRVVDCVIFDTDYIGALDGLVNAAGSTGAVIDRCTLLRTGRDGIFHGDSKRITITHNDISNVDLLNSDSGGIYSWGTDGTGSVIAYNHVHDNTGHMNVGIYIDNFCKGFTVHHNLSWNNTGAGITLNSDAENHLVANNTLVNNGRNFATFAYTGKTLTQKGTRIVNNLVTGKVDLKDPRSFAQGEYAPEVRNNGRAAIDDRAVPSADSAAVDAGIEVAGITDGFVGKAPDLGAYETGGEVWSAGATWAPPDMPKGERTSIAFTPMAPITPETMPKDGLVLWLDAADVGTIGRDGQGRVSRWRDKSGGHHDAVLSEASKPLLFVKDGMNGRPAVAGNGGSLKINLGMAQTTPSTLFVVARSEAPAQWQRLAAGWTGEDKDWVSPSWQLMIPMAEKPVPFKTQVFTGRNAEPMTLKNFTIFGTAMTPYHNFTGQIGEVLLFTRALRDDEQEAVENYLTNKWK